MVDFTNFAQMVKRSIPGIFQRCSEMVTKTDFSSIISSNFFQGEKPVFRIFSYTFSKLFRMCLTIVCFKGQTFLRILKSKV